MTRTHFTPLWWLNAFTLTAVLLLAYGWRWLTRPEWRS